MKQTKKLLTLVLLMSPLWTSCASTSSPEINSLVREPSFEKIAIPTCDELLDECASVVEKQKEAIDAQKEVIDLQDNLIGVQQVQVETEEKAKKQWSAIAALEAVLLALLILL